MFYIFYFIFFFLASWQSSRIFILEEYSLENVGGISGRGNIETFTMPTSLSAPSLLSALSLLFTPTKTGRAGTLPGPGMCICPLMAWRSACALPELGTCVSRPSPQPLGLHAEALVLFLALVSLCHLRHLASIVCKHLRLLSTWSMTNSI